MSLWHCWFSLLTCNIVPEMTFNMSLFMLNPIIPMLYVQAIFGFCLICDLSNWQVYQCICEVFWDTEWWFIVLGVFLVFVFISLFNNCSTWCMSMYYLTTHWSLLNGRWTIYYSHYQNHYIANSSAFDLLVSFLIITYFVYVLLFIPGAYAGGGWRA